MTSSSFNPARLLERLGGDVELLRELVIIFAEESPGLLQNIGMAIREQSFANVQKFSHKLKGSALQFSGIRAADLAASLEKMGADKSLTGADRIFLDLEREIQSLTRSLQSMASQERRSG